MLEVVRNLAIAWKNLHAYPAGHPALDASMAAAHRRVRDLVAAGGDLTLGVAKDALVTATETLSSTHARDLARALYVRDVALLTFEPGLQAEELEAFLRLVGADAARGGRPPLADELGTAGIAHVRVQSVDYSQVRATEDLEAPPSPPNLLEDVLHALLAGRELSATGRRIVDSGEAATTGGLGALVGEMLSGGVPPEARGARVDTLAAVSAALQESVRGHFARTTAVERLLAVNQVADLVRALPEDVRESVVEAAVAALAGDEESAEALEALSTAMAPDTILQALRRLKDEMTLSPHALRLVRALATSLEPRADPITAEPDPALLAELSALFRDEDIDRFNSEEHRALLDKAGIDVPEVDASVRADLGDRLEALNEEALLERVAEICGEMLGRRGAAEGAEGVLGRLESIFRGCVVAGRLEPAALVAERLRALIDDPTPVAIHPLVRQAMERMAAGDALGGVLDALHRRGPAAAVVARRLVDALGSAAGSSFLLALVEEPDKSRRRRLLDVLVSVGPSIVPHATRLLSDGRWYVVRNMIVLLGRLDDRTALEEVRRCAAHGDIRVRLEAIKWLLTRDADVPQDLLEKAIRDPDPKLAEAAVALAGSYGILEAVGPLLDIVDAYDLLGRRRSLRVKALRALGELGDPAALPRLDRYFKGWRLPLVALEERRAAFRALGGYPPDARETLVQKGRLSRDPEIRRLCERMITQRAPAPARGGEA